MLSGRFQKLALISIGTLITTDRHADHDAYVATLGGWQKAIVESLRRSVLAAGAVDERIK